MSAKHLVEICNLKTYFDVRGGVLKAVDDVSITIESGETLGLVGESACGKSVTAASIMRPHSHPARTKCRRGDPL